MSKIIHSTTPAAGRVNQDLKSLGSQLDYERFVQRISLFTVILIIICLMSISGGVETGAINVP